VDVSGRWPTDADLRKIARAAGGHETQVRLNDADVYDYLSGAALGFRPLPDALGRDAAATLPALITGSMLFTFRPMGRKWWDYLDQIRSAYETAEVTDLSVLPSAAGKGRMLEEVESRGTEPT
jgi:hypothetical protein